MEKIIYCFSGTGNSLRTAKIIAEQMGGARIIAMKDGTEPVSAEDEPFPPKKLMLPHMERGAVKIGREVAAGKRRKYPRMSPVTRRRYAKAMVPFLNVQHEYDKGFYVDGKCVGCRTCQKICPRGNITFENNKPVWNHACIGCNACVVYCPTRAIKFKTPPAYAALNNIIVRRLGLPDGRTRYHHPYITAADLMKDEETI